MKFKFIGRILAVSLLLLILCSMVSLAVVAAPEKCGEEVTYSITGTVMRITGKGPMYDFGDDNLAPWTEIKNDITKIYISDGVTTVGDLAFYEFENLKTVSLGKNVIKVGDRAFKGCTSLEFINFPENFKFIGSAAFESCENLCNIKLNNKLTTIGDYAFYRCYNLKSVVVPKSVQSFGKVIFAYCDSLTSVVVNTSLTTIPDWTFYKCENLTELCLPSTVHNSAEYAFYDCKNLNTIYYTGDAAEELLGSIMNNNGAVNVDISISDSPYSGVTLEDSHEEGNKTVSVKTISDENSIISTKSETSTYVFLNGTKVDGSDGVIETSENDVVEFDNSNVTTIDANISNEEGWNSLVKEVETVIDNQSKSKNDSNNVYVNVRLDNSVISKDDLNKLAGKDIILTITDNDGNSIQIDMNGKDSEFFNRDITLGYELEKTDKIPKTIQSNDVYNISFEGKVNFGGKISVDIGSDKAFKVASIYVKDGSGYKRLDSVLIDKDGYAWFDLAEVKGKYIIAIDAKDVPVEDARIPASLYEDFDIDGNYLYDKEGNKYELGDRKSSWGITSEQFLLYTGIGFGVIVLIVVVIIIISKRAKKSKYEILYGKNGPKLKKAKKADEKAKEDEADEEEIDEEALKIQIMKEMLAETENKKPETDNTEIKEDDDNGNS